jgi:hypothetical protein
MRLFLATLACSALLPLAAQDASLLIVPRWKVGDTRTMTIAQVRTEVENGETTEEREDIQARLRVVNETPQAFILRMEYDNVVLRQAEKLGVSLGEDTDPIRKLTLRYAVDRMTGKPTLENWEEVQRLVKKSYTDVLTKAEASDSTLGGAFKLIMMPIVGLFDKRENVEGYFSDAIGHVTSYFGKRYVQGDTLRIDEFGRNPFNGGADSIQVTTRTFLKRIDRLEQQAFIGSNTVFDVTALMEMMKGMMRNMMASMGSSADEQRKAQKKMDAEIAGMRFDAQNQTVYTVDLRTTWPISVVGSGRIVASAPGKSSTTSVVSTATFAP